MKRCGKLFVLLELYFNTFLPLIYRNEINTTPWSKSILRSQHFLSYSRNSPHFTETWIFITVDIRAEYLSPTWAQSIHCTPFHSTSLTLNLLTTTIVAPPSNASKWQMGFNSAFKGLISTLIIQLYNTNQRNAQFSKLICHFWCLLHVSNLVGTSLVFLQITDVT